LEQPGRNSAVVALSHDPKLDDPGLAAALASPCGYIGALGSRRSHAARLARLEQAGADPAALRRILGPVGLDIHAIGAGEIAVSILAEWIAQRRGAPLRERL
jgi:xanthine dehydrogenase accessory factor